MFYISRYIRCGSGRAEAYYISDTEDLRAPQERRRRARRRGAVRRVAREAGLEAYERSGRGLNAARDVRLAAEPSPRGRQCALYLRYRSSGQGCSISQIQKAQRVTCYISDIARRRAPQERLRRACRRGAVRRVAREAGSEAGEHLGRGPYAARTPAPGITAKRSGGGRPRRHFKPFRVARPAGPHQLVSTNRPVDRTNWLLPSFVSRRSFDESITAMRLYVPFARPVGGTK